MDRQPRDHAHRSRASGPALPGQIAALDAESHAV
jgi:hypothetical protein